MVTIQLWLIENSDVTSSSLSWDSQEKVAFEVENSRDPIIPPDHHSVPLCRRPLLLMPMLLTAVPEVQFIFKLSTTSMNIRVARVYHTVRCSQNAIKSFFLFFATSYQCYHWRKVNLTWYRNSRVWLQKYLVNRCPIIDYRCELNGSLIACGRILCQWKQFTWTRWRTFWNVWNPMQSNNMIRLRCSARSKCYHIPSLVGITGTARNEDAKNSEYVKTP